MKEKLDHRLLTKVNSKVVETLKRNKVKMAPIVRKALAKAAEKASA